MQKKQNIFLWFWYRSPLESTDYFCDVYVLIM